MQIKRNLTIVSLLALALAVSAQHKKREDINLWPETQVVQNVKELKTGVMHVFPADDSNNCHRAVILCPGGGYARHSLNNEGFDWVPFFRDMGYTTIVLRYRLPAGNPELPVADAEQAMRIVRARATEWGIDPHQVGIMGFSAGGHLASTLTVTRKADVRPDFSLLFYPVITMDRSYTHMRSHNELMTEGATAELERQYSSEQQVDNQTPPVFLALSNDDRTVLPKNAVMFYLAMMEHNRPASLHIYPTGRHGWGFRDTFVYHEQMTTELKKWLETLPSSQEQMKNK
ncbi:MAG: alpha/beta hydrolase [Prevotella sp.]|nr:alpha/beta hydrolase [Prevotella sp.]